MPDIHNATIREAQPTDVPAILGIIRELAEYERLMHMVVATEESLQRSLFGSRVARIAVERDCGRMEWSVLDWNEPSIRFYESLRAKPLDDWTIFRLTGDALQRCGQT